jgi:hypothetical protein
MKPDGAQSLVRILESAVILGWPDLMKDAKSGLLHLEYAFASDSSLDYVKLWSSKVLGHWHLVCEYWMSASVLHGKGMHFKYGFRSEGLTQNFDFIMQHQHTFSPSLNFGRTGLLQIQLPKQEEITTAANSVKDAYCHVNSFFAEPSLA